MTPDKLLSRTKSMLADASKTSSDIARHCTGLLSELTSLCLMFKSGDLDRLAWLLSVATILSSLQHVCEYEPVSSLKGQIEIEIDGLLAVEGD